MIGGVYALTKPLSRHSNTWYQSSGWQHQSACLLRGLPKTAHHKAGCRPSTALQVAQQFGETLTEVSTKAADPQQVLEEDQLRAAVEQEVPVEVPPDVLTEFEHELEEDLASVAVTLTAVTGVIIFWRGVWSLLDYLLGDSIFGDICCIFVGLTIVLGIRLSGVKVSSSFWPPS